MNNSREDFALPFFVFSTQVTIICVIMLLSKIMQKGGNAVEILIFVAGIIIGYVVSFIIRRVRTIGNLRIDRSIPDEEPYLFLELFKNVGDITKKKYVFLKVKDENYISQK